MAARTTYAEVIQILESTTGLTETIVNAYIAGATELVDEVLGSDTTITSALKEQIEMWLTAHMISLTRNRMAASEGAGGASITYVGKTGMALDSTPYGQMVKTLDSTGKFAALGGKKMSIYAVTSFD